MGDYYGIDFGGSNLRIAQVNPTTGEIGDVFLRSLDDVDTNPQLEEIIFAHIPAGSNVGISAAGKIDEKQRVIINSPNSRIKREITFAQKLQDTNSCSVTITNDMRAAVNALVVYGEARDVENVAVATYSSGHNIAVARKKIIVTEAEFGHLPYNSLAGTLFCSCGGINHLESYVSGNGAATLAKQYFDITHEKEHAILRFAYADLRRIKEIDEQELTVLLRNGPPELFKEIRNAITAKHVYQAYKEDPAGLPQSFIRNLQVRAVADSFGILVSNHNPLDLLVLMGSHALKENEALIGPAYERYNNEILQLPALPKVSVIRTQMPEIGVQGAVAYFVSQKAS